MEKERLEKVQSVKVKEEISVLKNWFKVVIDSFGKGDIREESAESLLFGYLDNIMKTFHHVAEVSSQTKSRDQSELLRELYAVLPEKDTNHFLFPVLKKKMIKTIVEGWIPSDHSEWNQDNFSFIASKFCYGMLSAEEKIMDSFLRLQLKGADVSDIEWWFNFSYSPSRSFSPDLERRLAMARANAGEVSLAVRDIRNAEIVEKLGIEDVADNMLPSLRSICTRQIELDIVTGQYLKQVLNQFLLSEKEKVAYQFMSYNYLEIHVFLDALRRGMIGNDWENFLKEMTIRMSKLGIISESGLNLVFNQQDCFAQLFICDLEGLKRATKMWTETMPF